MSLHPPTLPRLVVLPIPLTRARALSLPLTPSAHPLNPHAPLPLQVKLVLPEIATERVIDSKTLVEQAAELSEQKIACKIRLEESQRSKEYHKKQLRSFHRFKGVMEHVRRASSAGRKEAAVGRGGSVLVSTERVSSLGEEVEYEEAPVRRHHTPPQHHASHVSPHHITTPHHQNINLPAQLLTNIVVCFQRRSRWAHVSEIVRGGRGVLKAKTAVCPRCLPFSANSPTPSYHVLPPTSLHYLHLSISPLPHRSNLSSCPLPLNLSLQHLTSNIAASSCPQPFP